MRILVKTLHGLEEVLADELIAMGAEKVDTLKRAVQFEGDQKMLYRANLELRTGLRVLKPIHTFKITDQDDYYNKLKAIDWTQYMGLKDSFAIKGVTSSDIFRHSKYLALKMKDAVVDQFRENTGRRPNVNTLTPNIQFNVHINKDFCTVSLDSSGDSLYKRGYRVDTLEAPINESLAAGMILLSGWRGENDFVDPMCGSGTIPIEAALIAKNVAPNILRKEFGFQKWKDYDADLWAEVLTEAKAKEKDIKCKITGYDQEFKAVRVSERNAESAGLQDVISFKRKKFERLEPTKPNNTIVMNPPYDVRLQTMHINDLYKMIGDQLKQRWRGTEAWIISSNIEAMKHIGLHPSRKISLHNGSLECKFQKFEMYGGSKKASKQRDVKMDRR